ncbi:hypothetical protein AB0F77_22520 [Streptomyces sp. NPDC026672]|uniref:hypothetical protein n=1 Tax=unclassified Streptomyces TaxID=2593676 RepID=UPI0033CAF181
MRRKIWLPILAAIASVTPLLMAGPAQATAKGCTDYLAGQGYVVGPKVTKICVVTAENKDVKACLGAFVGLGVNKQHASTACARAIQNSPKG